LLCNDRNTNPQEPEMNASLVHNPVKVPSVKSNLLHRPGKQLRKEIEATLRDIAYVLHLTRQIKESLLCDMPRGR
jgi:hypothetical protein